MQIGMIGLGKMGANMVRRLLAGGHKCVVYDVNPENVSRLVQEGAVGTTDLQDFCRPAKFSKNGMVYGACG